MDIFLYPHDSRLERRVKAWLIRSQRSRLPVTLTEIDDRLDPYMRPRQRDPFTGRYIKRYQVPTRVP